MGTLQGGPCLRAREEGNPLLSYVGDTPMPVGLQGIDHTLRCALVFPKNASICLVSPKMTSFLGRLLGFFVFPKKNQRLL